MRLLRLFLLFLLFLELRRRRRRPPLSPRAFPAELDELEGIEGTILGFAGSMTLPGTVNGADLLTNFLKAKGARCSLGRITLPPTPLERVYKSEKEAGAGADVLEVEELLISISYADSFERPPEDPSKE